MNTRIFVLFLVALWSPGCALINPVSETFAGFGNMAVVRHPDRVDACILRFSILRGGFSHYEETEFVAVPAEVVTRLQSALLSEATYRSGLRSLCAPRYYVRLRFHQGAKVVTVDFCFDCMILAIYRDGQQVAQEDFNSGVFFQAMRQLFPSDSLLSRGKR